MRKLLNGLLIFFLLVSLASAQVASAQPASESEEEIITDMLIRMSPLEKVGQLMLISFDGTNTSENTDIAKLIKEYHIGGVILSTANENFVNEDVETNTQTLITELQNINYQKSLDTSNLISFKDGFPVYVPLYIGLNQLNENDHSLKMFPGTRNLPSQMTLGATWSPNLVNAIGAAYGAELSRLGFNLFLGPSLDLIDTSDTSRGWYTGTNSFGSDPYWVGKMSKAFVDGLHEGSENHISVIASHFPGLGGADRPPSHEVSTIQRSLDQLKQHELAPFLALTDTRNNYKAVDGVMSAHIRFQGLQGNIRSTTRPISFDPLALQQLLSVKPLDAWRAEGGLLISDSLGSAAVRSFFDPTELSFDAQTIARTAFLAGNDMLYLDNFATFAHEGQTATIQRTISFFAQKYQEDSVFAQRVDESVSRILKNKLSLYSEFSLDNVLAPTQQVEESPGYDQLTLEVARESLSLLAPKEDFLSTIINEGPNKADHITIISDSRSVAPCETCLRIHTLGTNAFAETFLNLYGGTGMDQIVDYRIYSYNFSHLNEYLDNK